MKNLKSGASTAMYKTAIKLELDYSSHNGISHSLTMEGLASPPGDKSALNFCESWEVCGSRWVIPTVLLGGDHE